MNTVQHFPRLLTRRRIDVSRGQDHRATQAASRRPRFMPACEALLGIVVILVIGAALPGQEWGLVNVQPHPLWIVVLAIAVRYGALSGYLAGGLSGLTYALLLWTRPEARFQITSPHELIQPFLMLVVGAVLGELVEARERRVAELETGCQAAETALESLWQRFRATDEVRVELQKQIAFQSNSIVTLSTLGRRLQSLHVPDLHRAIVDLVSTLLEVEACSLYLWHDGQLLMEASRPESGRARPRVVSSDHPLIRRAIRERRVVSLRDRLIQEGSKTVAHEPILMVGPLTLSGGRTYGVVLIESLPVIAFTPSTIDRLDMILGWASAALENALVFEQAQQLRAIANEKLPANRWPQDALQPLHPTDERPLSRWPGAPQPPYKRPAEVVEQRPLDVRRQRLESTRFHRAPARSE